MKFIFLIPLITATYISHAQVLQVSGTTASGLLNARANDYLVPWGIPGPVVLDAKSCALGNFVAGLNGNDYATLCFIHAIERNDSLPHPHRVSCQATSRAMINGDNTSTLQIRWKNHGANYASTDGYMANVATTLNINVNILVTGIPAGVPVTVYWRYSIFGAGHTWHEVPALEEDPITVTNSMIVNGVSQLKNLFNFASPGGLPGWNEWKNRTGNFSVSSGTNFNFSLSSSVSLLIDEPGRPGNFFPVDENDGIFRGEIFFSVIPQYPPLTNNKPDSSSLVLFSLDIGSDSELSDPQMNGNELFDPGDMYPRVGIPIPLPVPWKNDSLLFGSDPDPKPYSPINPAPVGSGLSIADVRSLYFDLDGSDLISTSLQGIQFGPGFPSIPFFSDSCVFEAEYLYLSYNDDKPELYTSVTPPSAPVTSSSPRMNAIWSDTGKKNEVVEFDFDPVPGSLPYFRDEIFSEALLHGNLAPNPAGNNNADDDGDALDIIPMSGNYTPCTQWYFSADHEASYIGNAGLPFLDPGAIYQATPAGPVQVVTIFHTGLLFGTDMNDFEFAWVWDTLPVPPRFGLAILFTVDEDDPMTVENESGGLNPLTIYYSFLNGTSQPFTPYQLDDNVDGLTVWRTSFNGAIAFPNPVWGTKTWTGADNENWANSLNWFPQGVPFYPEDVTIMAVSPAPLIIVSGFDCDDLYISKGAMLIIKSGATFEAQGTVTLEGP